MPTIASLSVLLTGDATSLKKATRSGIRALTEFGSATKTAVKYATAFSAASAALAAGGLLVLGKQAARSIDENEKLASQLGLTSGDAQILGTVAERSAISIETLRESMSKLQVLAGKVRGGDTAALEKFAAAGLTRADADLSPLPLFKRVIGGLRSLGNANDQAAAGNELFGESFARLRPLIDAGIKGFGRAETIFGTLGLRVESEGKTVEGLNDSVADTQTLLGALRDKTFGGVSEQLKGFADQLFDAAVAFLLFNGGGRQVAETLATVLSPMIDGTIGKVADLVTGLLRLGEGGDLGAKLEGFAERARGAFEKLGYALEGVITLGGFLVDLLQAAGVVGAGLLVAGGEALRGNLSGAGSVLSQLPGDAMQQFDRDKLSEEQLRETVRMRQVIERFDKAAFGGVFQ